MSVMPEIEIWKQFFRRYNRNPLDWRIYDGISSAGFPERLISSPNYSWMIKYDYSGRPGISGRIESQITPPKFELEQAGFRPIPKYAIKKMAQMFEEGFDMSEVLEAMKIIERILAQEPTTFDEIERMRPPGIIRGPILNTQRPLQSIIGGQSKLDLKLDTELEKMRRKLTRSYVQ